LATRLGAAATDLLVSGKHGALVGFIKGEIAATPLAEVAANKKGLDLNLLGLRKFWRNKIPEGRRDDDG